MRYVIGIVVPIIMVLIVIFISAKLHRAHLKSWYKDVSMKSVFLYGSLSLIKTIIAFVLIVLIHNAYHDVHLLELSLFLILFALFSIGQSVYSIGGFLQRQHNLYRVSIRFIKGESRKIVQSIKAFANTFYKQGTVLMKIVVTVLFIILFLPNFSLFVTGNLVYLIIILSLLLLSLMLNHIIYFGLISLFFFQFQPEIVTISNMNLYAAAASFIAIFIGFSIDRRLQHKMFFLITVLPVKRFNFKLGYHIIWKKKNVIVYQNLINHYYYVYYQLSGVVVVYHSEVDASLSSLVAQKMARYGKRMLLRTNQF